MPRPALRILVLVLAIAFALAPFFSAGFGGFDRGNFPVQVPYWPAQPPGWVFSIWGPIYAGLILAAACPVLRGAKGPEWDRAAVPLAVSLFIGMFWVETASRSPLMATAMILPMTAGAVLAMRRSGFGALHVWPLGLYAGWLTAASGLAVAAVLTGYGILGAQAAAVLMLVVVLAVMLAIAPGRADSWPYRLAVIWALVGVIAANIPRGNELMVGIGGVGIALVVVDGVLRRRRLA